MGALVVPVLDRHVHHKSLSRGLHSRVVCCNLIGGHVYEHLTSIEKEIAGMWIAFGHAKSGDVPHMFYM